MTAALVTAAAFLVAAVGMPAIISLSLARGFVDKPGELKVHQRPIPVFGGIGMFIAVALAAVVLVGRAPGGQRVLPVLAVAVILLALGVRDDLRGVSPRTRLAIQSVVAVATMAIGLYVRTLPPLFLALPLTAILIVGGINTVNLLDGLDGLAAGTVSLSLIGFAVVLRAGGDEAFALLALAVLGAALGFLIYNFNPARIFMGDNGSTFLGYVLAVLAIRVASEPYGFRAFAVGVLLIGLPIVDTTVAIVRRAVRRRPILLGDRSHIYDQLVDAGLSVRATALTCYGLQAALVGVALWLRFGS